MLDPELVEPMLNYHDSVRSTDVEILLSLTGNLVEEK